MKTPFLAQTEEYAKNQCNQYTRGPGGLWAHSQVVRDYALKLAIIEKANPLVVEMAALLHDIGKDDEHGRVNHAVRSHELAKLFLEKSDLSVATKELVLLCVLKHGTRFALEDNPIEVKILQCADSIAALFDDEFQAYCRKTLTKEENITGLEKCRRKLNLDSARKIASLQIERLIAKLDGE